MSKYRLSANAQDDLDGIWDYIAQSDPEAADRFVDSLYRKFITIGKGIKLGSARPELGKDVRMWPHGNYLIYFEAIGNTAVILRVIHSARDQVQSFEADYDN